jgi:hypothetical protein
MNIQKIIQFAKKFVEGLEAEAEQFHWKSYEHDGFEIEIDEVKKNILEIESCLHIPGVESKLDAREDVRIYYDLLENPTYSQSEVLNNFFKAAGSTLLWAKKMSWFGDWDLNFDGQHTLLSITFKSDEDLNKFENRRDYLHTGVKLSRNNYHLEIKSSESNLFGGFVGNFSDDFEKLEFFASQDKITLSFDSTAFKWDKSKFSGFVYQRPFYAERITEFFGKDHIIY